jgi:hypothetical protein
MPNHIKNKIEFIGEPSEVTKLVDQFSTFHPSAKRKAFDGNTIYQGPDGAYGWLDENTNVFTRRDMDAVIGVPDGFEVVMTKEWLQFPDFNKVFAMPECVKAVGNSVNSSIISAVHRKYNKQPSAGLLGALEMANRKDATVRPEEEQQFDLACRAYELTGYAYWYDWQNAHWGTKWNSYECEQVADNTFTFETAWSGVLKIILEISKSFNGQIIYKFADEDTSYNTGYYLIENGAIMMDKSPENGSMQAFELAFELRPGVAEYYHLVNGRFEYKDEY